MMYVCLLNPKTRLEQNESFLSSSTLNAQGQWHTVAWSEVPYELTGIWKYTQTPWLGPPSRSLSLSNHSLKFSSIDHRQMNYESVWRSWRLRLVRGSLQKNAPAQRHLQVGREWWIGGLGERWWKSLTFIESQSVFSIKPPSFVRENEREWEKVFCSKISRCGLAYLGKTKN